MSTLSVIAAAKGGQVLVDAIQAILAEVEPGDTILVVGPPERAIEIADSHLLFDLASCPVCGGDVTLLHVNASACSFYDPEQS